MRTFNTTNISNIILIRIRAKRLKQSDLEVDTLTNLDIQFKLPSLFN